MRKESPVGEYTPWGLSRYSPVLEVILVTGCSDEMEKFEYRNPRFTADVDAYYTVDGVQHTGRCREISKAGVTLQLQEALPVHSTGLLSLRFLEYQVEVRARVTHVVEDRIGLVFLYETDSERRSMVRLVDAAASSAHRAGQVLSQ